MVVVGLFPISSRAFVMAVKNWNPKKSTAVHMTASPKATIAKVAMKSLSETEMLSGSVSKRPKTPRSTRRKTMQKAAYPQANM